VGQKRPRCGTRVVPDNLKCVTHPLWNLFVLFTYLFTLFIACCMLNFIFFARARKLRQNAGSVSRHGSGELCIHGLHRSLHE